MFLPEDMPFSYFFFDTHPGYFLQMVPIALLAGAAYFFYRQKTTPELGRGAIAAASLFPAYLAALIGLTLLIDFISDGYYFLFYHSSPWPQGELPYRWLTFVYDFDLDFFRHFGSENLGNILLFLPFGFLYPLFNRNSTWKKTLLLGILTALVIELVQPLMDRSFDINDLVLNTIGAAISTLVFYVLRCVFHRHQP